MKRESLYLHETEVIRNGREQTSSPRGRGGPSSPRRVFDRTGVVKSSKQASRKSVSASSRKSEPATASLRPDWHFKIIQDRQSWKSSFWRDAKTSTRDARATRQPALPKGRCIVTLASSAFRAMRAAEVATIDSKKYGLPIRTSPLTSPNFASRLIGHSCKA